MGIKKNRPDELCTLRKDIGKFIRKIRFEKSLTGSQFGKLLNVSQQQISRYENGVTSMTIETLSNILDILGSNWVEFYHEVLIEESGSYHLKYENKYPIYFK